MSETTTQTPAATPETPAAKPERVKLPKQNGVSRPSAGTQTGRVWEIADQISAAQKRPAFRKEVMEQGKSENINPATIATQYGRWRKFFGLGREATAPKAAATPAAPAASSDVSVEQK